MHISAPLFATACTILLLFMCAAMAVGIVLETQTYDEGIHLSLGFAHWTKGEFTLGPEHPPFARMVCALPLLFLGARMDTTSPSWQRRDQVLIGADFVYGNRIPGEVILGAARAMTAIQTLILGVLLAVWTSRRFGRLAGLIAVALFALSPNFIAHGHYATNDVPIALFMFATLTVWLAYLEKGRVIDLVGSGVLLGLTTVCKFSGVLAIPAMLALLGIRHWRNPGESVVKAGANFVVVGVLAVVVISAAYGPAAITAFTEGPRLEDVADRSTSIGRLMDWFARGTPLPAHPFLIGVQRLARYTAGQPAYLLGDVSHAGWWYYFPVAIAVKSTTALLFLVAVALALAASMLRGKLKLRCLVERVRSVPMVWFALTLPPLLYLVVAMNTGMNIGVRHVLPVYPFVIAATAGVLARAPLLKSPRKALAVFAVAATLQAYEHARVFPHYTAFFNTLAGGPENGPRYLVDSNIDWGQDVVKLGRYLDRIGYKGAVCKAYFGTTRWWYYGVPESHEPKEDANNDCLAAVSVTALHGVYTATDRYRWLREKDPVARIGYSIYLYDLRAEQTPIDWKDRGLAWR